MFIWLVLRHDKCYWVSPNISHGVSVSVNVTQLCSTLCDPMYYTDHGILQARILQWVAFPFSRVSKLDKMDVLPLV